MNHPDTITIRRRVLFEKLRDVGRLGRHICFDERSRNFPVRLMPRKLASRVWTRPTPVFDQGDLGSCTGQGAVGVIATMPFRRPRKQYSQRNAVAVYKQATKIDEWPGSYPPEDTGSSVLAAMKAMHKMGKIKAYRWCFGLQDVLAALSQIGPVEVGTYWYSGFDYPANDGLAKVSGYIRGGHAYELLGIDVERKRVLAVNSWGAGWGKDGYFSFSWADLDRLLREEGEAATVEVA